MADITIFAFVWGDTHNHFIPEWHEAIQNLEVQPADVIVATNPDNPADVYGLPYTIMELPLGMGDDMPLLNEIVAACKTRWVGECDIDDVLCPEALNHISDANGYDACANTIRLKSNGSIVASRPEMFHANPQANHVMVNTYFTKEIFDRVGGYPLEAYFQDWGLWWKLHKHQAKWFPSPGIQMIYNDIPSPNKASCNFPAHALQQQLDWIATYQPENRQD
jgi:hypothetical protein